MTAFILTCSVDLASLQDCLSTLRFGEHAKQLKNKVKANKEITIEGLKFALNELEEMLSEYKRAEKQRESSKTMERSEQEEEIYRLTARCERLTEERDELRAALQHIYDQSTIDQMEFVKSLEHLENRNEMLESLCKQQTEQVTPVSSAQPREATERR